MASRAINLATATKGKIYDKLCRIHATISSYRVTYDAIGKLVIVISFPSYLSYQGERFRFQSVSCKCGILSRMRIFGI